MKKETIRKATEAHGWVGLFISIPLFIVFWAGSITLFLPEVVRWASLPQYPISVAEQTVNINSAIQNAVDSQDFDESRLLFFRLPGDYSPYINLSLPVYDSPELSEAGNAYFDEARLLTAQGLTVEEINEKLEKPERSGEFTQLLIDPSTGKVLNDSNPFELANYLNHMHYTLHIPQGRYIIGVITFFFLVIIFTGIVIQLKNLIKHFFLYRRDKTTRYKMNDLHNVVGVISLPFGLMYALTGVMFNLGIIFQLSTAMLLYKGDFNTMLNDAGIANASEQAAFTPKPLPDLQQLITDTETEYDATITGLNIQNYGDTNSLIRVNGVKNGTFSNYVNKFYSVRDEEFSSEYNPPGGEIFYPGITLLFSMHLANFAALDARFIYFFLGMAFCGLIVAGNVLWFVKRAKKAAYPKTLALARALTLGGCFGVMGATAVCFFLERTLPATLADRPDFVTLPFWGVLFAFVILGFFKNSIRKFMGISCCFVSFLLYLTFIADIILFGQTTLSLFNNGQQAPAGVALSIFLIGSLTGFIGFKLLRPGRKNSEEVHVPAPQGSEHVLK